MQPGERGVDGPLRRELGDARKGRATWKQCHDGGLRLAGGAGEGPFGPPRLLGECGPDAAAFKMPETAVKAREPYLAVRRQWRQ